MIYFEVRGGLCNRMRALASAYAYAQERGQAITVLWPCNGECNCRFDTLFKIEYPFDSMKFIYIKWFLRGHFTNYKNIMRKIKKKCDYIFEEDSRCHREELFSIEGNKINIFCGSYCNWYRVKNPYADYKIKENIARKVRQYCDLCGEHGVGVHIRRTDNELSIKKSPTELFIKLMQKEIHEYPDTKFFIASDDEREKEKLREIFGEEQIVTNDVVSLRNTKKGMVYAAVDLYILAGMSKIIGSSNSSFSEAAANIGNIPLIKCELNTGD